MVFPLCQVCILGVHAVVQWSKPSNIVIGFERESDPPDPQMYWEWKSEHTWFSVSHPRNILEAHNRKTCLALYRSWEDHDSEGSYPSQVHSWLADPFLRYLCRMERNAIKESPHNVTKIVKVRTTTVKLSPKWGSCTLSWCYKLDFLYVQWIFYGVVITHIFGLLGIL